MMLPVVLLSAEVQRRPYFFTHESAGHPELMRLRERLDLDEKLDGRDEFRRMEQLRHLVFSTLKYDFRTKYPQLRNSHRILDLSAEGAPFICSSYAALYMQAALSFGWHARYWFLRRPTGEQHAAVDIWSNQYEKWIFMDPTWNIHFEKDGVPLSLVELRRLWIEKSANYIVVFGGNERVEFSVKDMPIKRNDSQLWRRMPVDEKWISYFYEPALVGRSNFFTHGDGSGRNIWNPVYIIKDAHNRHDTKWPFRYGTPLSSEILFAAPE